MKTITKLRIGILLFLFLTACEKDTLESGDAGLINSADVKAQDHFNNGMIHQYSNDVVLQWNDLVSASIDNSFPQPLEVKMYAMITLAMHDALNNVIPKYETYALDNSSINTNGLNAGNINSIADAAVSQAARNMLATMFPPATQAADELLADILSGIEDSELKMRGVSIGNDAAQAILAKRSGDFPLRFTAYIGPEGPGLYQSDFMPWMIANQNPPPFWPDNAVFSPDLGNLTPFGIETGDQFRDEEPFPLNSAEYLKDYNEVKALGCESCAERSAAQTAMGIFWIENNSSSMNRLCRALIEERKLNGWEAARLVGLVHMAIMDAYIASFDGKYAYRFWRPVSAVRNGDNDGVVETIGDPEWKSLFTTPPTPEFPSTHAYSGAAAATIFKEFFRSDQLNMKLVAPYSALGVERDIKTFSQISKENAESRIYIGYHFRNSTEVGERQGKELGKYVFENNLRELKKIK